MRLPSPLMELRDERLGSVRVLLKRDDLIHPVITGNKWRKLRYLVPAAREAGASTLLTFGGAYSNHVRALAAVGKFTGFRTIGVIRGEERPYNPLLAASVADGMRLHYLDRTAYRRKTSAAVVCGHWRDHAGVDSGGGDYRLGGARRRALQAPVACVDRVTLADTEPHPVPVGQGKGDPIAGRAGWAGECGASTLVTGEESGRR